MNTVEKKKLLKKIIDELPEDNLDEALILVEELMKKDEKRTQFVQELLEKEENLFNRLAQ